MFQTTRGPQRPRCILHKEDQRSSTNLYDIYDSLLPRNLDQTFPSDSEWYPYYPEIYELFDSASANSISMHVNNSSPVQSSISQLHLRIDSPCPPWQNSWLTPTASVIGVSKIIPSITDAWPFLDMSRCHDSYLVSNTSQNLHGCESDMCSEVF